jgi:acyl transferase domain-containing protein/acyl carrier protein
MIGQNTKRTGLEIAVIGMDGRFPGAKNLEEYWENLKNGVCSLSFLSEEEIKEAGLDPALVNNPNYVNAAGGVLEAPEYFDASFFDYLPAEAEMMLPHTRIFHECVWHALEDAGYDPGAYDGLIGLYAGATSSFNWEARALLSGAAGKLGVFASNHFNSKDYLTTLVSYKLNLKGPSITQQTACSSSLVAIDQACRALLTGICDMALAGGAAVSVRDKAGYMYQEGLVNSPDGYCRAFDAGAKGTVDGEGVGVVLLKRLDDALGDGDHIYAVIKGFAVNNDGMRKSGFTAPSVEGQVEVIRAARQMAEVEFESIGYIETHGTGTPLGDPIEVKSLKSAFNTNRKQFCGIGSVKTNIGHLDAAAGVAAFIKTVLAVMHRQIPPSLFFKKPNPEIDFNNSPFYVVSKLEAWESNGNPLRAGISSFGIGGTNAHVILEEWHEVPSPAGERGPGAGPPQLLLLSAKTASALDKMMQNLAAHFKKHPGINFADAVYTLQVGRKALPYRSMLVCSNIPGAVGALTSGDSAELRVFHTGKQNRSIVFMFSGQGAQYVNMGLDLYGTEPVFRKEMDRCFEILGPLTGYDLKAILYPGSAPQRTQSAQGAVSAVKIKLPDINRTEIAQPVLFVLEYALAKLLMSWGIVPGSMIGHSIGEYTAACLAGVFSLEDALKLVVVRGQLMQEVPPGAMLGVTMPEQELTGLLAPGLSLAAVNGANHCVVSGACEEVEAFKGRLEEDGYTTRPLHTSHAFHSQMMDPIIGEFTEKVRRVRLNKPAIPYVSNVTGRWISVEEAADPRYWAQHLRKTVRFAAGIEQLVNLDAPIFIEVGPGNTLSTFARHHKPGDEEQKRFTINLIRHPRENGPDDRYLINKIGELWLYGAPIDWPAFYAREERKRLSLPIYPFEGKRFWISQDPFKIGAQMLAASRLRKKEDMADWFYVPSWERSVLPPGPGSGDDTSPQSRDLIFLNDCDLCAEAVRQLERHGRHVILVSAGDSFYKQEENRFRVNPGSGKDYDALFLELREAGTIPNRIIHLWNVTEDDGGPRLDDLDRSMDLGLYSLLNIVQAMGRQDITAETRIDVVTGGMQEVMGGESRCPLKAPMLGAVKIIPLEYRNISCRSIDIVVPGTGSSRETKLISQLVDEFNADTGDNVIAYRGDYRWVQAMKPVRLDKREKRPGLLKEKGVYLIVGGFGGMGFTLARYFALDLKAGLILVGRSQFPGKHGWDEWLDTHDEKDDVSLKIKELREWEEQGAEVMAVSADAADFEKMKEVLRRARERFGQINGVIHAAGVIDYGGFIQRRTREAVETAMASKIRGTLVLDRLLEDSSLDFLLLFSSLGNMIYGGKFGEVGYNAANEFLDAFAHYKNRGGGTFTAAINWADWEEVGMSMRAQNQKTGTGPGDTDNKPPLTDSLTPAEGVEIFNRILGSRFTQTAVCMRDLTVLMQQQGLRLKNKELEPTGQLKEAPPSAAFVQRPELTTRYAAPRNKIEQVLVNELQNFLGIEKVGINDNFFDLGATSLTMVGINRNLNKALQEEIPLVTLFNYTTVRSLAEYLVRRESSETTAAGGKDRGDEIRKGKKSVQERYQRIRGRR